MGQTGSTVLMTELVMPALLIMEVIATGVPLIHISGGQNKIIYMSESPQPSSATHSKVGSPMNVSPTGGRRVSTRRKGRRQNHHEINIHGGNNVIHVEKKPTVTTPPKATSSPAKPAGQSPISSQKSPEQKPPVPANAPPKSVNSEGSDNTANTANSGNSGKRRITGSSGKPINVEDDRKMMQKLGHGALYLATGTLAKPKQRYLEKKEDKEKRERLDRLLEQSEERITALEEKVRRKMEWEQQRKLWLQQQQAQQQSAQQGPQQVQTQQLQQQRPLVPVAQSA